MRLRTKQAAAGSLPCRATAAGRVVCNDDPMKDLQQGRREGYGLSPLAVQLIGYCVLLAFIVIAAFFFSSPSNTLAGP
jgi:hypothetical protein